MFGSPHTSSARDSTNASSTTSMLHRSKSPGTRTHPQVTTVRPEVLLACLYWAVDDRRPVAGRTRRLALHPAHRDSTNASSTTSMLHRSKSPGTRTGPKCCSRACLLGGDDLQARCWSHAPCASRPGPAPRPVLWLATAVGLAAYAPAISLAAYGQCKRRRFHPACLSSVRIQVHRSGPPEQSMLELLPPEEHAGGACRKRGGRSAAGPCAEHLRPPQLLFACGYWWQRRGQLRVQ